MERAVPSWGWRPRLISLHPSQGESPAPLLGATVETDEVPERWRAATERSTSAAERSTALPERSTWDVERYNSSAACSTSSAERYNSPAERYNLLRGTLDRARGMLRGRGWKQLDRSRRGGTPIVT